MDLWENEKQLLSPQIHPLFLQGHSPDFKSIFPSSI